MKHIAILGLFVLILCNPAQAKFAPCPIGLVTSPTHIRGTIRSVYPVKSPENAGSMNSKIGVQIFTGKKSTSLLLDSDTKFLLSQRADISHLKLDSNVILVGSVQADITIMAIAIGLLPTDMAGSQHRHWDRGPRGRLTQGKVSSIEPNEMGLLLNIQVYEKFSRRFQVTSRTAINIVERTSEAALRPGQQVVAEGSKLPDCNLHGNFIFIGVKGNTPPF